MKAVKTILAILACGFLAGAANPALLDAKSNKQDPIVGVWLQNQRPTGSSSLILAAQAVFNADGTVTRNIDPDLQRVLGLPDFPEGTVFSISDDYSVWKKKSKHRYECVGTQIMLVKNEDGTFTPLARAKCVIDIKVCDDTMTATETLSFYDYYDLSLTVPFEPLSPLHFKIEGKRLK